MTLPLSRYNIFKHKLFKLRSGEATKWNFKANFASVILVFPSEISGARACGGDTCLAGAPGVASLAKDIKITWLRLNCASCGGYERVTAANVIKTTARYIIHKLL